MKHIHSCQCLKQMSWAVNQPLEMVQIQRYQYVWLRRLVTPWCNQGVTPWCKIRVCQYMFAERQLFVTRLILTLPALYYTLYAYGITQITKYKLSI